MNRVSKTILCVLLLSVSNVQSQEPAKEQIKEVIILSLPNLNWGLEIDAPGFAIEKKQVSKNGDKTSFQANNDAAGLTMSAFLEKAPNTGTSKDCRDYYFSKLKESPAVESDVKMSEIGEMAIAEYVIKELKGIKLNQKHLNAYLAKNGYWIDVHISKADFEPQDQALFDTILKGIRTDELCWGEKSKVNYYIPDYGTFALIVPTSWQNEILEREKSNTLALGFKSYSNNTLEASLSTMPAPNPKSISPAEMKAFAQEMGADALGHAIETELVLKELKGTTSTGYYFTLTDKAPKPGE